MPPSPDANSRSSGASDNNPLFNLQSERLSFEVTNLFSQPDLGAYTGLKKMVNKIYLDILYVYKFSCINAGDAIFKSIRPKIGRLYVASRH